jgi:hypothetical protein
MIQMAIASTAADAWMTAAQRFCSMVALNPSRFSK